MIQTYTFCDGGSLEFDDARSVRELLEYAFDEFDFYEPFGADTVTLFQAHHPDTNTGWFTSDANRSCAEEIRDHDWLCFACHRPGVFYYAEGGWGHHMKELGNRPVLPAPVSLHLRFEDFDHTVMFNGNLTFRDVLRLLINAEYIPENCSFIRVIPVGCGDKAYSIPLTDPILDLPLTEFEKTMPEYNAKNIRLSQGDFIYHEIFEIC